MSNLLTLIIKRSTISRKSDPTGYGAEMPTDRIAAICCLEFLKNERTGKTMQMQAILKQIEKESYTATYADSSSGCSSATDTHRPDISQVCMISDFLLKHGLYPHLPGYRYLRSALLHAMADPDFFDNLSRVCYPQLAQEFHTNERCVERAIRHAPGRATDSDQCIIPQPDRCSNREFMVRASEYIRLHLW